MMARLGPAPVAIVAVLALCDAAIGQEPAARAPLAVRDTFLRSIDRPRVALDPQVNVLSRGPTILGEHFTFSSQEGVRVPGVLRKPVSAGVRHPAVIVLHGTGGTKEDARIVRLSEALVGRGFVAVAIDGRYHGERVKPGARATEYVNAMLRAYLTRTEQPFLYDTVWDVMRLVDFLETREDVDARRIGIMGISKGGMETYLAAAADPRIAAAVPVIGVQSFRWALDHDAWQSRVGTFQSAIDRAASEAGLKVVDAAFVRRFYDRVVPGIYGEFDAPAMLPLIAPRPLLIINGDSDPRTPLPGVRESAEAAEKAYRAANARERFQLTLQPNTGHAFTEPAEQQALDWFVKWLKP
jgi:dienelactone hydrolase